MNKILIASIAVLAVVGVAGATSLNVSAQNSSSNQAGVQSYNGSGRGYGGSRQASLESRAGVVGMTVEELQTALETKTMSQIAKEKGMTEEDFRTKMEAAAKARWEARGLTTEQITERLAEREKRHAANSADHEWGSGEGGHQGGYGRSR